ncbi:hypothetical protein [Brachybacterium nesterenkovii]|uniref:hypothetical protein n=1 Tax=Brachybacterium nesterenkovii TaxID=47847 RepID=UPI00321B5022
MGGVFTDQAAAVTWVQSMVPVDTPPVDVIEDALSESLIVDSEGRAPVDPGYVPTWSGWYSAALVLEYRADVLDQQPGGVTSFTSEGSTVTRSAGATPESLRALAARWRARALGGDTGITVLSLGATAGPLPRSAFEGVTVDADDW